MDMYGYNEALSQSNNFSQYQSAHNQAVRQRNEGLDHAVGTAKASGESDKRQEQSTTESELTNNIIEQATTGLGIKKFTDESNIEEALSTTTKIADAGEELHADVSSVIKFGEDMGADVSELKTGAKALSSGATALGGVGAVVGGGLALADDLQKGGWKSMNWEEKFGNVLSLGGATSELVGLGSGFIPLDIAGAGMSLLGSLFTEIGEKVDEGKKKSETDKDTAKAVEELKSEKEKEVAVSTPAGAGASAIQTQDSSNLIKGTGSF